MKQDIMDILACPVCKGELDLSIESSQGEEVIKGLLVCGACNETYPIEDSIPNLLPPAMRRR